MTHNGVLDVKDAFDTAASRLEWLEALSLDERIALYRGCPSSSSVLCETRAEINQNRVTKWRVQPPFNEGDYFAQRLSHDGLSIREFEEIVSLRSSQLKWMIQRAPDWLLDVDSAFIKAGEEYSALTTGTLQERGLLVPFEPVIVQASNDLKQYIDELVEGWKDCPLLPNKLVTSLRSDLYSQVHRLASRTMVLELNVARVNGELQGETPEDRYASFIQSLMKSERSIRLLSEYPVLLRSIKGCVENWLNSTKAIFSRLRCDWEDISDTFFQGESIGLLSEYRTSAGDRHRHGQAVTILRFTSGRSLVYKPHSVEVDRHYGDFINWMSANGLSISLKSPRVISRSEHGWVEYVQSAPCVTAAEVQAFYKRVGVQLAILYVLEATDFHFENIIAVGEHPVLVDLEALFHPQLPNDDVFGVRDFVQDSIYKSVLRIGLLPMRLAVTAVGGSVDLSGISGGGGQLAQGLVSDANNTDAMRFVRKQVVMEERQNKPVLDGKQIDPQEYETEIVLGFIEAYRLLKRHRVELQSDEGLVNSFRHDEVRAIVRNTKVYAELLRESYHPNVLRSAMDRERMLDRLWVTAKTSPGRRFLIPYEQDDLRGGDIPYFSTRPGSRSLWTSSGEEIENFLPISSMNAALDTVSRMSNDDLAYQVLLIRSSIASLGVNAGEGKAPTVFSTASNPRGKMNLIGCAEDIADYMERLAFSDSERIIWNCLQPGIESWGVGPTNYDLYSGLAGISLFFGFLGHTTGSKRYTNIARRAINTALNQVRAAQCLAQNGSLPIGAFSGAGGIVYTLHQLGVLLRDAEMLHQANCLAYELATGIASDNKLDIVGGSAGLLIILVNLYRTTRDEKVLAIAKMCADHLLEQSEQCETGTAWMDPNTSRPRTGFAHGTSGMAYALSVYSAIVSEEKYWRCAEDASRLEWRFIDSGSDDTLTNDFQLTIVHRLHSGMAAWCHGTPGIAMSQLRRAARDPDLVGIVDRIAQTLSDGGSRDHSLCHGDMGIFQLLIDATVHLEDKSYEKRDQCILENIIRSADGVGWRCATPGGVETPGLMLGLAGIGYGILRAAHPRCIPSVLMLESVVDVGGADLQSCEKCAVTTGNRG